MTAPRVFSASEIESLVTVSELLAPLSVAMRAVSDRDALHPPRFAVPVAENGRMGLMYGALPDPPVHGAKILSLYPDAPSLGLSSHQGYVLLFDSTDGQPIGVFDADAITAMRTAAMTVLATQTLARPNPHRITICGGGEQAAWHARAFSEVFDAPAITIWCRRAAQAAELASGLQADVTPEADLHTAVAGADVVVTATAAREPFFPGRLLEEGQHLNLVGASLAHAREIDDEAVRRVTMFTDALDSAGREAGEIIGARDSGIIDDDYSITEIGAVLSGTSAGRTAATQITAYKSHGLIAQDLVAAHAVLTAV